MTLFDQEVVALDSGGRVADINRNARIVAGPGAGKTHWLVCHVRRVSEESGRLGRGARIACISYTNVAVSEILARLGNAAHTVEAGTVHAFLYKFVVRPYVRLLRNGDGSALVNHADVEGHDEHKPSPGLVRAWVRAATGKDYVPPGTMEYLKKLRWVRAENGTWALKTISYSKPPNYFPSTHLLSYKPLYWRRGILDHDDVLYLAHRILEENPSLSSFIAARFPYVVVDEFQDTSPVQATILRWLAGAGATVTVIGDREQSIYGFQGASPSEFGGFSVPNLEQYVIAGNRRSTATLVGFLNLVRQDGLVQEPVQAERGIPVRVCVGNLSDHLEHARQEVGGGELACLVRRNEEVRAVLLPSDEQLGKPWEELEHADWERCFFLEKVFRGAVLSSRGKLGPAVKEVVSSMRVRGGEFRDPVRGLATDLKRRSAAVAIIDLLARGGDTLMEKTLVEIYLELDSHLFKTTGLKLAAVKSGKFGRAATKYTGLELAACVRVSESDSVVRTIHQAKGAEFESVIVRLDAEGLAENFLLRKGPDDEERRLYYVAVSRAKQKLFVSVPGLSVSARTHLKHRGIEIVDL